MNYGNKDNQNKENEDQLILIQKRHPQKYHSGGLWANACCSHPRKGETYETAVKRRMTEELGRNPAVDKLYTFIYRTVFPNGLSEYEYDYVYLGEYWGEIFPAADEISEICWIDIDELSVDLQEHPERYTVWFLTAAPQVILEIKRRERIAGQTGGTNE